MGKQEEICKNCQHRECCDKSVIGLCLGGKCPWRGGRINKQEEIRDWVDRKLEDVFSEFDHWDCSEECGHKVCLIEWKDKLIGEILSYLHSQGVVISNGGTCAIGDLAVESLIEGGK